jgi:predicted RNA-binding protein with PIN domain
LNDLYIVDGYNFIFNTQNSSSADLSVLRDKLVFELTQFKKYYSCELVVVFDAKRTSNAGESRHLDDSVVVIFSKKGQTADSIVEKLVHASDNYEKIFVVTSDYHQQKVIFRKNVYRKSINEFKKEIEIFREKMNKDITAGIIAGTGSFYCIENRLSKNTLQNLKNFIYGKK